MDDEALERLTALLDGRRGELHALPGVLATGITSHEGAPAVELVVGADADAEVVLRHAAALLGGAPVVLSRSGGIFAAEG